KVGRFATDDTPGLELRLRGLVPSVALREQTTEPGKLHPQKVGRFAIGLVPGRAPRVRTDRMASALGHSSLNLVVPTVLHAGMFALAKLSQMNPKYVSNVYYPHDAGETAE